MTIQSFHSHSFQPTSPWLKWIVWLVFAIVWFGSLGHNVLIHPDEGRYASISLGMLQSGDWVTPRLDGLLYFEKPALPYWMGALCFKLFGINEFAARLWPAVCGFLSVVLVGSTARRLWGEEAGHLSALVMGSCCWVVANSHFLNLDSSLTFFLTVSLCTFLLAQRSDTGIGGRRILMWLCWAGMAGATLSKGLIGIVIPGATLVLYSLLCREFRFWGKLHLFSGLLIFLALAAPWFVMVSLKNHGFANFFFIHEHFQRFLTTEHKRTGPIWYFVPFLVAGFLPWTTLLPGMCLTGTEKDRRETIQSNRLLLIWSVFIFLFFSKSGSKLPSYILPMFPALALLAGHYMARMEARRLCKHLIIPSVCWLALLVLCAFTRRFASDDTPVEIIQHFARFIAPAAVVFLIAAACAWRYLLLDRKRSAVLLLALASVVSLTLVAIGYNGYAQLKSTRAVVAAIQPSADTELFSVRTYDQTFPFYLRRNVTLVDYVDEFELGENTEPSRWIPSLEGFVVRWNAAPRAMAMMQDDTYETLQKEGVPMRVVYRDTRHLVVSKP